MLFFLDDGSSHVPGRSIHASLSCYNNYSGRYLALTVESGAVILAFLLNCLTPLNIRCFLRFSILLMSSLLQHSHSSNACYIFVGEAGLVGCYTGDRLVLRAGVNKAQPDEVHLVSFKSEFSLIPHACIYS